jgi:hypothetical protein
LLRHLGHRLHALRRPQRLGPGLADGLAHLPAQQLRAAGMQGGLGTMRGGPGAGRPLTSRVLDSGRRCVQAAGGRAAYLRQAARLRFDQAGCRCQYRQPLLQAAGGPGPLAVEGSGRPGLHLAAACALHAAQALLRGWVGDLRRGGRRVKGARVGRVLSC